MLNSRAEKRHHTIIGHWILLLFVGASQVLAEPSDHAFRNPSRKSVLGTDFPKAGLAFRGENRKAAGLTLEQWEQDLNGSVGVIRKFVNEELDHPVRMDEKRLSSHLKQYAKNHPSNLLLLHFNCRAKLFDFHADKFWVGHYLQQQGVQCDTELSSTQSVIRIPANNRFQIQKPFQGQAASEEDSLVLLVERDHEGVFNWDKHEFAYLLNVDRDDNMLTVRRGAHGTTPTHFARGRCYITQIKQYRDRMVLNLSPDCPRDPTGRQAADVLLDLFESWFQRGGPLEPMDGIAFDVQYWDIAPTFDTDLDGIADGGIIDGEPRWARGVYSFSKSIRQRFGDNFIITSDGHRRANSQALGAHNGIESEGLVQHNDGWRGISRTVNTHRYWNEFNTAKLKFSYIAAKLVDREDAQHPIRLRRFAHAMAACLGIACTNGIDDVTKGIENQHFWLGKPLSPMINLAESSGAIVYQMPTELNGHDLGRWSSADAIIMSEADCGGIRISPRPGVVAESAKQGVQNRYANLPALSFDLVLDLPPGDFFMTLDAKSSAARTGFAGTDVPRLLSFEMIGHHEDARVGKAGTDIWTLVGSRDYFTSEFYVRNAGGSDGRKNVRIRFQIDGQDELFLKNVVVRNTPALYVRQFENGVVLVNPSLDPHTFDLDRQFGEYTYRRLRTAHDNETADTETNNGAVVHTPETFELGPVSAQFLIKESIPSE